MADDELLSHTMTQVFSEFWRLPGVPLVLEGHMDPIWIEFEVSMLLAVRPYEIEAPGTPEMSHGTDFCVLLIG